MKPPKLPAAISAAMTSLGALSRREILAVGASDNDLRRWVRQGVLLRVRGGIYTTRTVDEDGDFLATLRGAAKAGDDVVVSHRAAAALYDLPLWSRDPIPEVTRAEGGSQIPGVRVHRYGVAPDQIVQRSGLRVTSLERTLIDVCRVVPLSEALVTLDAAARDLGPDFELFGRLLEQLGDINFRKRAWQAAQWVDGLAENPFESFSRGQLLQQGIPRPLLQWWVGDGADTWYRPDKLWPWVGLIGEADGRGKYRRDTRAGPDPLVLEKDRQDWFDDRDFALVRWGVRRIALTPGDVAARWRTLERRQISRGWTWPEGVWLVRPGPWPPSRAGIRDEAARVDRSARDRSVSVIHAPVPQPKSG